MYNYYQQSQQQVPQLPRQQTTYSPALLKGHPVSSLEEVKATSIDFDGSIFYFPDIANKRIYTKTIGLDGVALLNMYELKPLPQDNQNTGDFITRQEFEKAINDLTQSIQHQQTQTPQNFKEVF